jgi:DNA-binding beta-propeller fold protein YncE
MKKIYFGIILCFTLTGITWASYFYEHYLNPGEKLLREPTSILADKRNNIFVISKQALLKYDAKGKFLSLLNDNMFKLRIQYNYDSRSLYFSSKYTFLDFSLLPPHNYNRIIANYKYVKDNVQIGFDVDESAEVSMESVKKEMLNASKYLQTNPKLEEIIAKIIFPSFMTVDNNGAIFSLGRGVNQIEGNVVGVLDPEDGHPISTFRIEWPEVEPELEGPNKNRPKGRPKGPRDYKDPSRWIPRGIAVDSEDNIYALIVNPYYPYCVRKYARGGKLLKEWGAYGQGEGEFLDPQGIAVDRKNGFVYVTDVQYPRILGEAAKYDIQKFTLDGKFIKRWEGKEVIGFGPIVFKMEPKIYFPEGIAVDKKGNVCVIETGASRISKFNKDGKLLLQFGNYGSGEGEFKFPYKKSGAGIAVDAEDNIYVSDMGNNRIQKFDKNGKFLMEIK